MSPSHASYEKAGRREDMEERALQPCLVFSTLLSTDWERAIVVLRPHNTFVGWDMGSAGDSLMPLPYVAFAPSFLFPYRIIDGYT
jgi:hypothetical protein